MFGFLSFPKEERKYSWQRKHTFFRASVLPLYLHTYQLKNTVTFNASFVLKFFGTFGSAYLVMG
jgi:hypothetical protein